MHGMCVSRVFAARHAVRQAGGQRSSGADVLHRLRTTNIRKRGDRHAGRVQLRMRPMLDGWHRRRDRNRELVCGVSDCGMGASKRAAEAAGTATRAARNAHGHGRWQSRRRGRDRASSHAGTRSGGGACIAAAAAHAACTARGGGCCTRACAAGDAHVAAAHAVGDDHAAACHACSWHRMGVASARVHATHQAELRGSAVCARRRQQGGQRGRPQRGG